MENEKLIEGGWELVSPAKTFERKPKLSFKATAIKIPDVWRKPNWKKDGYCYATEKQALKMQRNLEFKLK